MNPYRSLFLGHGAPSLALSSHPANAFLRELGQQLPKPRAAIVVSPHWMAPAFAVKSVPRFEAWHDFSGFPRELYALRYAPEGDAVLARKVFEGLSAAGIPTALDSNPRIDHGVWVPLMLLWPEADVPTVQVAVGPGGPAALWRLGETLKSIVADRDDVLVIGSGSLVHNLREIDPEFAPATEWARDFDHWMSVHLASRDQAALTDYRAQAPSAARAHPSDEHLLPLFAAAGAGGAANKLHESFSYGSLSMSAYGFT